MRSSVVAMMRGAVVDFLVFLWEGGCIGRPCDRGRWLGLRLSPVDTLSSFSAYRVHSRPNLQLRGDWARWKCFEVVGIHVNRSTIIHYFGHFIQVDGHFAVIHFLNSERYPKFKFHDLWHLHILKLWYCLLPWRSFYNWETFPLGHMVTYSNHFDLRHFSWRL